jgi:NADH-quinone oxidoreductase E subunit
MDVKEVSGRAENAALSPEAREKIAGIVESNKNHEGALINVLHETQEYLGYIPYEAQVIIAEGMGIPLTEVYGVITFYSRFTLNPVGKYKIGLCMGTACYVKGSDRVLDRVQSSLKLKSGETSPDGLFSLEATRCIGACGLAPVMMINEDVYGKLTPDEVDSILEKYRSQK